MVVDLPRPGKVLIQFTATALFQKATDKRAGATAVYRSSLLVDGQPIAPTVPPLEVALLLTAAAMPALSAGGIVSRWSPRLPTPGVLEFTRNQALSVMGVLD